MRLKIILLFPLFAFALAPLSCNSNHQALHSPESTLHSESNRNPNDKDVSTLSSPQLTQDLITIRDFAERYQPVIRKEREGKDEWEAPPFDLEMPDPQVADALSRLSASHSHDHEKYIILIVLRLYRVQLQMANQSYDIRRIRPASEVPENQPANWILIEYCRLTRAACESAESVSSAESYDWAISHPELQMYEPIRREVLKVQREEKRIKKGR